MRPLPTFYHLLLPLCLSICLTCARTSAVERLDKGMTMDATRATFGEPETDYALDGGVVSWSYLHGFFGKTELVLFFDDARLLHWYEAPALHWSPQRPPAPAFPMTTPFSTWSFGQTSRRGC